MLRSQACRRTSMPEVRGPNEPVVVENRMSAVRTAGWIIGEDIGEVHARARLTGPGLTGRSVCC